MSIFVCSKCQAQFPKWLGQCLQCGAWGTIAEQNPADFRVSGRGRENEKNVKIVDFSLIKKQGFFKIKTGLEEVDRVLGGGIVQSSVILLGGQPGIGKSTLVLQIAEKIEKGKNRGGVLYVSGEESAEQMKLRLDRLDISGKNLKFLGQTEIKAIADSLEKYKPNLVVIDSIQTITSSGVDSKFGSANQIRAAAAQLVEIAKKTQTAVLIIGHVTKEGIVAGPKTLEHLVDTVLYLEGDPYHHFRFLRAIKNRFGSTNEIGVFEMQSTGLEQVENPSARFLENRDLKISGSAVSSVVRGDRSFLVEVQALVSPTSFKYPQRKCSGFDLKRLSLLIAVIGKRLGLNLSNKDIHINIVGGLQVNEPAADLAVALAIISAFKNKPIDPGIVVFGEVGLGGEIRAVTWPEKRIQQAIKIGFKKIICPKDKGLEEVSKVYPVKPSTRRGVGEPQFNRIKIVQVKNLGEAVVQLQ